MAAIDHSAYAPASPAAGFAASISRGTHALAHKFRTYVAYQRTLTSLSSLSRRQLQDIGLDGADIETIARDMARQNTL